MSLKQRFHAFLHPEQIEYKVNPERSALVVYGDAPQPATMPKNIKNYLKEGYSNDTVFKCISYVSRNGGAIPPVLYTDTSKQKKIEQHPLLDKLNNPNGEQSGVAYREACLAYKLITGNNYQYALRANAKYGPPDELWNLNPSLMEIVAGRLQGIVGYKHLNMEGMIDPANIGHTKYFNPDDANYGMSPIQIGAILIDMQTGTRKWNLALVQNSARPSGAWTVPTPLSLNDRNRLEQKLKEKLTGSRNAGTPPVLDAGLTWQSMGLPPAELDWLESIKYNAVLIANIYNMPPQLVGDTSSSTYNNMEQAKAASYTEAIFPDLDDLYAMWNNWLVPMYPDLKRSGAYLYYDKDSVEVLQSVIQAQKTAQAQRAVVSFLNRACTLNEARVLQGLTEVPEGDVYRIGLVLIPANKLMEYAEQSMTLPATAPKLIPEPLSVNDPLLLPGQEPPLPVVPPAKHAMKYMSNGVYQPDDLDAQLITLRSKGVTHLQWFAESTACETCMLNNGVIREVGQAFPSGHILPTVHDHCECEVRAVDVSKSAYRSGYKAFMEATAR